MKVTTFFKTTLSVLALSTLTACATKSNVKSDGTTDEPVFPEPYSLTFNNDRGTFPTTDELSQVKAGLTKDDLYKLLGRPHYDEGLFGVREWDYLFHFHTPGVPADPDNKAGVADVTTCQFKVIFDKDKFARSFFWKPVFPKDAICPAGHKSGPNTQRYTIDADALFAFDKSGNSDINPAGKAKLDDFAEKVRKFDSLHSIRIEGHTDRLGGAAYNQKLSEKRAETVRRYLISKGVPAGVMSVVGYGKTRQVKECASSLPRNQLIECLHPNRRVEIEVDGSGKLN
ncbi:SmpA/OmlA family protein [Pasteurella langaaensis DSM 22999]|uniref:SmpA/OmlA family protein n=1 Tax=Alitibacter langaaensis DSM 22999 TaxID=1122935 RepID=A0A2U0TH48_9PAST|nr:OmpA family protein [Pasteurella langaaensis]PVX42931.1 SmpA/OmlA family protein [Pasteurella langaaensis DSM 22999]